MKSASIREIAKELNNRAIGRDIGRLQEIRKQLKGLGRRPGQRIFSGMTTDGNDEWAFHHGGRSELQFNIGRDGTGKKALRHGVAFSFETSRTLPSIDVLKPKVRLFNDYLRMYPDQFASMRMWHWDHDRRSDTYSVANIHPELVRNGVFVFLGRLVEMDQLDYESILNDFDNLLPLYRYVESNGAEPPLSTAIEGSFTFRVGCSSKLTTTLIERAAAEVDANLRHNLLQESLYLQLVSQFGSENVGTENLSGVGTRIDIVVRRPEGYWFYEIKTAFSPRACIREALSQLLEYSLWPGAQEAIRLVVVGESSLDNESEEYLIRLRDKFSLPIFYEQISI